MDKIPSSYIELSTAIDVLLRKNPSSLVAIAGKTCAGKTHLARYLAWEFQVSILETDMFLRQVGGQMEHDTDFIREALVRKKKMGKPVIIEGCVVLPILDIVGISKDYLVYVERQRREDVDALSSDPFWDNSVRQPLNPKVFGSDKCHLDAKEKANFVVSL